MGLCLAGDVGQSLTDAGLYPFRLVPAGFPAGLAFFPFVSPLAGVSKSVKGVSQSLIPFLRICKERLLVRQLVGKGIPKPDHHLVKSVMTDAIAPAFLQEFLHPPFQLIPGVKHPVGAFPDIFCKFFAVFQKKIHNAPVISGISNKNRVVI